MIEDNSGLKERYVLIMFYDPDNQINSDSRPSQQRRFYPEIVSRTSMSIFLMSSPPKCRTIPPEGDIDIIEA